MKLKIAVVQFQIKQFVPEESLKRAEEFIKKAARAKANIIVFPEDFIVGAVVGKTEFTDTTHKYRKHFQALAKKYKIDIVPGSISEGDEEGLHNVAYYIDSNGKVKGRYKKVHLWHPERGNIFPGHKVCVFNTRYGKVGLAICWDLMFPEVFRAMARKGVKIVICPSYWCFGDAGKGVKYDPNSEVKLVDALCIERAFENEIVLVYCNGAGKFKDGDYEDPLIGQSQITTPFHGIIKKLDHNKEKMFIQEVNTEILKDAEDVYEIRSDLKKKFLY